MDLPRKTFSPTMLPPEVSRQLVRLMDASWSGAVFFGDTHIATIRQELREGRKTGVCYLTETARSMNLVALPLRGY